MEKKNTRRENKCAKWFYQEDPEVRLQRSSSQTKISVRYKMLQKKIVWSSCSRKTHEQEHEMPQAETENISQEQNW